MVPVRDHAPQLKQSDRLAEAARSLDAALLVQRGADICDGSRPDASANVTVADPGARSWRVRRQDGAGSSGGVSSSVGDWGEVHYPIRQGGEVVPVGGEDKCHAAPAHRSDDAEHDIVVKV